MPVLDDLRGTLRWLDTSCAVEVRAEVERAEGLMRQAQAKLMDHNTKRADIARAIEILEAAEEKPSDG